MWSRRTFLKSAGTAFLASLGARDAAALANADMVFASTCQFSNGRYGVVLVSERGDVITQLDLPARGHDITQCPVTSRLVAFARRPGTFAIVFEKSGQLLQVLTAVEGRHFFGHGVFSADGRLLYTTENDFDAARGVIGVYDATDKFNRVGELSSGGMDPHDILLIDESLLCVANGGIETHPDYGRQKLNLATMDPNLSWVNRHTGDVVAKQKLPSTWYQVSLRHLARGSGQSVWIGGQYQGPADDPAPLLLHATPDDEFKIADLEPAHLSALSNYVGSVAASDDGRTIVATSPVGNSALVLDVPSGAASLTELENVCGASFAGPKPILSSGNGDFGIATSPTRINGLGFDNHLFSLQLS